MDLAIQLVKLLTALVGLLAALAAALPVVLRYLPGLKKQNRKR